MIGNHSFTHAVRRDLGNKFYSLLSEQEVKKEICKWEEAYLVSDSQIVRLWEAAENMASAGLGLRPKGDPYLHEGGVVQLPPGLSAPLRCSCA